LQKISNMPSSDESSSSEDFPTNSDEESLDEDLDELSLSSNDDESSQDSTSDDDDDDDDDGDDEGSDIRLLNIAPYTSLYLEKRGFGEKEIKTLSGSLKYNDTLLTLELGGMKTVD